MRSTDAPARLTEVPEDRGRKDRRARYARNCLSQGRMPTAPAFRRGALKLVLCLLRALASVAGPG